MKPGILLLLLVTGAFFSCKKKAGNIVIDGQGDGTQYGILRTETFDLKTTTIMEDSLPGNGLRYALLGNMTDPLLGKTRASVFASIALLEPNSDFPNTKTPDSAVLYMPMVDGLNFYGDRGGKQLWKICQLTSAIDGAKVYYQTDQIAFTETAASYYTGGIYSAKYDSVRYKNGKIEQHPGIRIKLSAEMAKKLMQMPKAAYQDDASLNTSFEGLAILPQDNDLPAGKGGVGVFDLAGENPIGSRAAIMLYYDDTSTFVFTFAGTSRIITKGSTGPFPTSVTQQLAQPGGDFTTTYVQALNGVKSHIQLTDLFNLVQDGNVAINKAEIIFTVDKSSVNTNFFAPVRLNLFRPTNASSQRNYLLRDAGSASFGGTYDESKGTYTFSVTRHIQDVLNAYKLDGKDINYGLYLTHPTAEPVLAGRVAIDQTKTRLVVTYTKLN